jgi:hypothetical protein
VIDGSQTNREAILSCDAENRLQDRTRCDLKPIFIRQSAYLNNGSSRIIGPSRGGFDLCSASSP